MKHFVTARISNLLALAILLAGSADALQESPGDPAAAAIAFLSKIADESVDLGVGTDTAISPHVGIAKRREIEGRIKRMALDLEGGTLAPGEVRVDGDMAGVIVEKAGGFNPETIGTFAVALLKNGEKWLPAPLPASFENTGVLQDLDTRRRATALERWMLSQRALTLDELRNNLAARVRGEVAMAIERPELQAMSVGEVARAFLQAAADRNQLRLLGMLGGLSDPLPEDWAERLSSVGNALNDLQSAPPGWRAVAAPEVMRVVVHEEQGARDGLFSIAFIDPASEIPRGGVPPVQIIHIDLERDAGGVWRLNLPSAFGAEESEWRDLTEAGNPFDSILFNAYPARLRTASPPAPEASAEALWARICDALAAETPAALLQLLALPDGEPEIARRSLGRVLRFWWHVRMADGGRAIIPLSLKQQEDQAVAMAQLFAFRDPESVDLRMFHMIRNADGGWMWQSTGRNEPAVPLDESLATWRDEQRNLYLNGWQKVMLTPVVKLDAVPKATPVAEAEAETAVKNLLEAIANGDLAGALECVAVLDDAEGHTRLLRNLGYELSVRLSGVQGASKVLRGDHWAAVACRRKGDANPGMAFFPVVATEAGPRVLLELDLFVGTRRRDFLNNVALERLENFTDAEIRIDLRALLQRVDRE